MRGKMKNAIKTFGWILVVLGILGFLPQTAPDHFLFGVFYINELDNLIHLITGSFAIWVGYKSIFAEKLFFKIACFIYLVFAILGYYYGNRPIFGVMANNYADAWLHLLIALIAFYFGFFFKAKRKR
jgi:hypothetical protein